MSEPIIHHVEQGSAEWRALRASHCCSSDAPAMMGVSPYKTRDQLIQEMAGGPRQESSNSYILDEGHRAEAAARPKADEIAGEVLYPAVMSREVEGIFMLASMDGINMARTIIWEHKLSSRRLRDQIAARELAPQYYWQIEHQMLVSGADMVIFMASSPDEKPEWVTYTAEGNGQRALIDGWRALLEDVEKARGQDKSLPSRPDLVATPERVIDSCERVSSAIKALGRSMSSDADYAQAETDAKWLKSVEAGAAEAKELVLLRDPELVRMLHALDGVSGLARSARLDREKAVKARKADIGQQEVDRAMQAIDSRLGARLSSHERRIREAIKGRRTRPTMSAAAHDALTQILAEGKPSPYALWLDAHGLTDEQMAQGIKLRDESNAG